MPMLSKKQAIAKALSAGGSLEEIERQAANFARQVGSIPFRNMIVALNLHPWNNDRSQWERLAAALVARANARRR